MRFSYWARTRLGRGALPGFAVPSRPWPELLEACRHAERTGWDGIWLPDHFMPLAEDVEIPWMEAWTLLAGLAVSVPRVRLGTLVTGNTYRHPAVLAKMATTIDHLSGGRMVLGLGAGWQENEHRAYGIPFPGLAERLDRLEEACRVIALLLRSRRATFRGEHYSLDDAPLEPKPIGRLPLLVGGSGERRTLRIVAEHADEWNSWGAPSDIARRMEILARHCEAVGRDPGEIEVSAVALLFLSRDAATLAALRAASIPEPSIIGTPDEVCAVVEQYRDLGVAELVVPDFTLGNPPANLEAMDRFIEEVAPAFR